MWIYEKRDALWNIVRWDVENNAYWSNCDATVLYGAAVQVAKGTRALGYSINDPAQHRDAQYYKDWIVKTCGYARDALGGWRFLDCSLDAATAEFKDAARRIKACSVQFANVKTDESVIYPAHLLKS
jgi:hypothetical protein